LPNRRFDSPTGRRGGFGPAPAAVWAHGAGSIILSRGDHTNVCLAQPHGQFLCDRSSGIVTSRQRHQFPQLSADVIASFVRNA
jgi:hypothetical protein